MTAPLDRSGGSRGTGGAAYAELFGLKIGNGYYNRPDIKGPVFGTAATAFTARYMADARLLMHPLPNGFSVYYDAQRKDDLLNLLRGGNSNRREWLDKGAQTWLSFTASPRDLNIIMAADIPFDLSLQRHCYYLSNRNAHGTGPAIISRERRISGGDILPVLSAGVQRSFDGASEIELLDASGEIVLCYPRQVPLALAEASPGYQIGCKEVREYLTSHPDAGMVTRDHAALNLASLRAGKYSVRYVGGTGPDENFVYLPGGGGTMCFIDLFLADPGETAAGIYPVTDLFEEGRTLIEKRSYTADFAVRDVYWNYHIVPLQGETVVQPEFFGRKGDRIAFGPPIPSPVQGRDGAFSMQSSDSYPLQDRPDFWMEFRGGIEAADSMSSPSRTLVQQLPTPDLAYIRPVSPNHEREEGQERIRQGHSQNTGVANIYVYL